MNLLLIDNRVSLNANLRATVGTTAWSQFTTSNTSPSRLLSFQENVGNASATSRMNAYYANFAVWKNKIVTTTEMTTFMNSFV